jgi:hypothetical protein
MGVPLTSKFAFGLDLQRTIADESRLHRDFAFSFIPYRVSSISSKPPLSRHPEGALHENLDRSPHGTLHRLPLLLFQDVYGLLTGTERMHKYHNLGTAENVIVLNEIKALPFRNLQVTSDPSAMEISGEKFKEKDPAKAVEFLISDEASRCLLTSMVSCLFARGVYTEARLAECLKSVG